MASFYEPMFGQAWRDELHSFLPHALDCVDSNCLLPLCVNLKLTLRHVQLCEKVEKCTICQGMKSLAATHSNSCRDYYCRVPFCMEAKVTTQQQILMDQLVKTSDAGLKSQTEGGSFQVKETGQEGGRDDFSNKVTADPLVHQKVPGVGGCPEQVAPSDKIWPKTECPQPGSKILTQSPVSMESIQSEWMEHSPLRSNAKLPKSSHTSAQGQLHGRLLVNGATSSPRNWCEQTPTATATDHAKDHAGVKRKLQSFISNNKSTSPSKVRRPSANEPDTQKEDCPEIEIVESKSFERFPRKANGATTSNDVKNRHQKRKPSNLEFLPKPPSRHVAIKQNKQASTMPVSSLPVYTTKRNSLSKTSTLKTSAPGLQVTKNPVKACYAMSNSSEMDLGPVSQVEDQITDDSVDCYIDEMFSTPPPSPTFGMWLGETIQTNDSTALKTVLLETLFQLLGVVTQPKTEQQDAVFVELLERTLRVMKTAIAK